MALPTIDECRLTIGGSTFESLVKGFDTFMQISCTCINRWYSGVVTASTITTNGTSTMNKLGFNVPGKGVGCCGDRYREVLLRLVTVPLKLIHKNGCFYSFDAL